MSAPQLYMRPTGKTSTTQYDSPERKACNNKRRKYERFGLQTCTCYLLEVLTKFYN